MAQIRFFIGIMLLSSREGYEGKQLVAVVMLMGIINKRLVWSVYINLFNKILLS